MNEMLFSRGGFPVITKMLFDNLMNESWNNQMLKMKSNYPMNIVQVRHKGQILQYRLQFAFAGFKKEELSVQVKQSVLNVSIHKGEEIRQEGYEQTYLRQGLSYKDFQVNYKLMDDVDIKKIKVSYQDGILYIVLPIKKEQVKSYKLKID